MVEVVRRACRSWLERTGYSVWKSTQPCLSLRGGAEEEGEEGSEEGGRMAQCMGDRYGRENEPRRDQPSSIEITPARCYTPAPFPLQCAIAHLTDCLSCSRSSNASDDVSTMRLRV